MKGRTPLRSVGQFHSTRWDIGLRNGRSRSPRVRFALSARVDLPHSISWPRTTALGRRALRQSCGAAAYGSRCRSEEHTSELQSPCNLVCRLLLEKKKKNKFITVSLKKKKKNNKK